MSMSCRGGAARAGARVGFFALFLSVSGSAAAEQAQTLSLAPSSPTGKPAAIAIRVAEGPALDGDVLGDPVWTSVPPISGFWQEQPDEGQPASEQTEVRLAFTNNTLYIGVVCYDRDP